MICNNCEHYQDGYCTELNYKPADDADKLVECEAQDKKSDDMKGIDVKQHMTQTIALLDTLVNTEGVHNQRQRQDMYAAQILLIEVFGPADIRNLNEER